MTLSPLLKIQVQRRLKQDLAKANAFFERTFLPPTVSYAVRGRKAGVAYLERNEVRFNPILLQENGVDFIDHVVPHELAHILVYQLFGRVRPHGKEWKLMMETVLGVPAQIYHHFDTTHTATHFLYRCHCQTHQISVRRHNAITQAGQVYVCKKCRATLQAI